jgi:hypothetical protein
MTALRRKEKKMLSKMEINVLKRKKVKVLVFFISMLVVLFGLIPRLSIYAAENSFAKKLTFKNIDKREYSDTDLTKFLDLTSAEIREKINTRADAITLLNIKFTSLWHSLHSWQSGNEDVAVLRSAEDILEDSFTNENGESLAGRSDVITVVTYLLSDNAEIGSLYGFWHESDGSFNPIKAVNYVMLEGKCVVFDPVLGMKADKGSRKGLLFPEDETESIEDYINSLDKSNLATELDAIYLVKDGQAITFEDDDGWTVLTSPDIKPMYVNKDKDMTDPKNIERKYGHIKAENISKYEISKMLGGKTLSIKDADALVGKPPEELKEKISTAADIVMYMLAARLKLNNGDEVIFTGGYDWHYNPTARQTLEENLGNCGRMANLANYLLEGDYQEIGFILHSYYPGNGGGHVYNYIKYKNKYYIVDFSSYLFNNYDTANQFNIISMDKLEDYGERWDECYGGLAAIVAHTSIGTHLPNVWYENYYYLPDSAKFNVLFETPRDGYEVETIPCPDEVPDWNLPQ